MPALAHRFSVKIVKVNNVLLRCTLRISVHFSEWFWGNQVIHRKFLIIIFWLKTS